MRTRVGIGPRGSSMPISTGGISSHFQTLEGLAVALAERVDPVDGQHGANQAIGDVVGEDFEVIGLDVIRGGSSG